MKLICFCSVILFICSVTLQIKSSENGMAELEKLESKYVSEEALKNKTRVHKVKNVPIFKLYGDIYWEGWIKYFHYDHEKTLKKPESFFKNPEYYTQKVLLDKLDLKDLKGRNQHIPSPNHFWGKLLATGNFDILTSRESSGSNMAHTVQNLNTDLIKYIKKDDNASGSIRDLGKFSEGHCISIQIRSPPPKKDSLYNPTDGDGEDQTWVICTDKEKDKKTIMSDLISMTIERQNKLDDILLEKELQGGVRAKSASELMKPAEIMPKVKRGGNSNHDGYLILLQDWSPCSVKCGGGISTQQWLCVPPKEKGKPCPGGTIVTRKCNILPCPIVKKGLGLPKNDKNHITLNPIYTALPFSKRPQQYVKCVIKEGDVLYDTKEYDPYGKTRVKVPARIVMNTNTISVFRDDGYNRALFNFNLKDTAISKSTSEHCCFYITSQNRQEKVCGFGVMCGTKKNPVWVNQWLYDSEYFLKKCRSPLGVDKSKDLLGNGKPNVPGGNHITLRIPLGSQANALVDGKRQIIQKQVQKHSNKAMDKKVNEAQRVTMIALRREINLEDLIKKEEVEKGKKKMLELKQQVAQEKKKRDLLKKALGVREKSYAQIRKAKETQLQLDDIKHEAKMDIKFKRSVLKKKLESIRMKFKRRHRMLQQQIQLIRAEVAQDIMEANKCGDQIKCKNARGDIKKIADYCDANVSTDYIKNQSCKEPDNFCYRCCEIEFGNMFISKRDECTKMCDDLEKKDLSDGDWIWTTSKK